MRNDGLTYRVIQDPREMGRHDRFFMMNGLEFSEEHPVDTERIKCWEADDGQGEIAGAVVLALRQGKYIIDGIAVSEKYRGSGLGGELLDMALDGVRELGGEEVYLVARAPGFFRGKGFGTAGREQAPDFFECLTCPQRGVSCFPEIMRADLREDG